MRTLTFDGAVELAVDDGDSFLIVTASPSFFGVVSSVSLRHTE